MRVNLRRACILQGERTVTGLTQMDATLAVLSFGLFFSSFRE